jgi:predicted DNA-binding transcriptional regulator YafY
MPPSRISAPPGRPAPPVSTRLHLLIEWLRSGRTLTTSLAAEAIGVSRRTITRDLNHLRNALCLSIRYDPVQGTYALDREHAALPFVPHPDLVPILLSGATRPEPGPGEAVVHMRFSQRAARAYAAASGIELPGTASEQGTLDLYFAAADPEHFLRWILSCGAEAEVIAPDALRCRVAMEIRRMLDVYPLEPGDAA